MQLCSGAAESAWEAVFIQVYLSPYVWHMDAYVNVHI